MIVFLQYVADMTSTSVAADCVLADLRASPDIEAFINIYRETYGSTD